jgi:hypothetical protein
MDVAVPKGKGTENEEGKYCGKDGKRKSLGRMRKYHSSARSQHL